MNLRLVSIILGILVAVGITAVVWRGVRTHQQYAALVSPYDVCLHMKHLIHAAATQHMLAQKDDDSDSLATIEGIAKINAFSVDKCTDTLHALRSKAPVEYSIRTRCLSEAKDEATATLCVRN